MVGFLINCKLYSIRINLGSVRLIAGFWSDWYFDFIANIYRLF